MYTVETFRVTGLDHHSMETATDGGVALPLRKTSNETPNDEHKSKLGFEPLILLNPTNVNILLRMNDRLTLKPIGRVNRDENRRRDKLLHCKKLLNIATMNVRTIRDKSKQEEISKLRQDCHIDILSIDITKSCIKTPTVPRT